MLPGGMWVLGVFITGIEDILDTTSNVQKLKSVLGAIHKTLSWNNKHLCGNNQDEKLILAFNSITQKYAVWNILLSLKNSSLYLIIRSVVKFFCFQIHLQVHRYC